MTAGQGVLVHCFAGVSRSATIVLAYLMQEHGMSYTEAMKFVKAARWFINPNEGFRKQLLQFQRELKMKGKMPKEETKVEESGAPVSPDPAAPKYGRLEPRQLNYSGSVVAKTATQSFGLTGQRVQTTGKTNYGGGFGGSPARAKATSYGYSPEPRVKTRLVEKSPYK